MICPGEPSGNSALANWLRKLVRYVRANELQSGVNYKVRRTTCGTTLEIAPQGSNKPTTTAIARYMIKSVAADYLVCHTWDGTNEGVTDVNIAKPQLMRHAESATIRDKTWTYAYTQDGTYPAVWYRDASWNLVTVRHVVTPPYQIGDSSFPPVSPYSIIHAIDCDDTGVSVGGIPLTKLQLEDGRTWAKMMLWAP